MSNSIMFLDIRRSGRTWIFDDPARGVIAEPFVAGIPEMIDRMVEVTFGAPRDTCRVYFSAGLFPGWQGSWEWLYEDTGGNWYRLNGTPLVGWLCPCLGKYFDEAPQYIYLRLEEAQ